MTVSTRDGYEEAAMFLFYDDGELLIEHRPSDDGTVTFIPNGSVEESDRTSARHDDHIVAGMLREIDEELQGRVTVEEYEKLCEVKVDELSLWFHAFVVTDWRGDVPEYTVEDGERFADLEWIPLAEYDRHLSFHSAVTACERLLDELDGDQG